MITEAKDYFKGWAIPGPRVPGFAAFTEGPSAWLESESLDALCGQFRIFQLREGHRFSTDDLLAAWYGTTGVPCARRVLDLGSGIGSVGMVAAWRLQGASFVTVEAQEQSVILARKSVKYNGLESRYEIRQGDLRDAGVLAVDERFDLILGSPPYFPLEAGITAEHPQKVACRFEVRGTIADYSEAASRHLEMGGVFSCVFPINPARQLQRVKEGALAAGLSIVRMRPVVLKEGDAPLIAVFLMMKSEHLPESFRTQTWCEPALVIRTKTGGIHLEYSTIKLSFGFSP